MKTRIFNTSKQAVVHIAEEFLTLSKLGRAIHISLSGGSTPKLLFQTLAHNPYQQEILWKNLHFWWGDERMVAPTDSESNYGQVQKLLFDHIDIPAQNIHPIRGEANLHTELERLSNEITKMIPDQSFDWIILGMGNDGHTASLFPHHTDFTTTAPLTLAQQPQSGQIRISKTAHLIEKAYRVSYLVTGASKAKVISEIFTHDPKSLNYPAANIRSKAGVTEWYLDSEAAALLK